MGLNVDLLEVLAAGLGSALAGLAAVLSSFDTNLVPTMGFSVLLLAIIASTMGGHRFGGAVAFGILLGILRQLSVWQIPAQWQDTLTFTVFAAFLVAKQR